MPGRSKSIRRCRGIKRRLPRFLDRLGKGVFAGLKNPFTATRYHSLSVEKEILPPELEITAWTEDGDSRPDAWGGWHARHCGGSGTRGGGGGEVAGREQARGAGSARRVD